jgi:hypothetical protein
MAERFLRLLDTVVVSRPGSPGEATLIVQGSRMLRIRRASAGVQEALTLLQRGIDERQLLTGIRAVRDLVSSLDQLGWLTADPARPASEDGWDRQVGWWSVVTRDGQAAQRRLAAASVAILGMGGIGALVAQHLVAGGVQRLWLIDYDTVAAHNLNRQYLYQREDIGMYKTEAAVTALRRFDTGAELSPVRIEVSAPQDLDVLTGQIDLLVVAADRPADLMDTVWAWAKPRGVPLVGAGVGLETGYWGPLLDPARGHCWPCFEQARVSRLSADERRLEAESAPTPYSFGPTNSIIADLVARDAMLFLAVGRCACLDRRRVLDVAGLTPATAAEPGPGGDGDSGSEPMCAEHRLAAS